MAIFGAPLENNQHAACAIECALEMMVAHAQLLKRWSHRGISPLAGIGIATGEAIVGEMGCKLRTDYTCMGRPINLGSRLCDLAKPNGIRISQSTLDAANKTHKFEAIEHSGVAVKGLTDKISIFEVVGEECGVSCVKLGKERRARRGNVSFFVVRACLARTRVFML